MTADAAFVLALKEHDESVVNSGLAIWLGSEPTFTDRASEAPEWLSRAEGGEKSQRALAVLQGLCHGHDRPLLLRTIGRQYPGEKLPRWSFGLYASRSRQAIWTGPPDPALGGANSPRQCLEQFPRQLTRQFLARGWNSRCFQLSESDGWRVVFRVDGTAPPDCGEAEGLARPSIHGRPIPEEGLSDPLAAEGDYLLGFDDLPAGDGAGESDSRGMARLELPAFPEVPLFLECLDEIGKAAADCGLRGLILQGFPPPVDASVAWMTVTPDPAVVEVNMAPTTNAAEFYPAVRDIYQSALAEGLSPYRFYYNGDATDSGGGGQITFGGPSPVSSPFFLRPWLLPNMVRYSNRHPALAYFFTPSCVGSSSQSPRPDERFRESFAELSLGLELLSQQERPTPDIIWESLAPFLSDPSGNNHRSEINVEKLWNPLLGGRGCLGLVEFRAFRMARTPEMLTARAVLFRALLAMLAKDPDRSQLTDWGAELHDRFALPYYLKRDLAEVFADLAAAGFALADPLQELILDDDDRLLGEAVIQDCQLTVHRALEFWPLVGDVASQEAGNSRLIDSSTARIQVVLRPMPGTAVDLRQWRVAHQNWAVPVRLETDASGDLLIFAVKYRAFSPWRGLHPTLLPQSPVELTLHNLKDGQAWKLVLHEWNPDGGPYASLPEDWAESRLRRRQRVVVQKMSLDREEMLEAPPPVAVTAYCLDLRAYGL